MTHFEFFINRTNVYDVPELNKEQFLFILKVISLEAKIEVLNNAEDKKIVSKQKLDLIKEFNKLTKRKTPEHLYKSLNFSI